MKGLAQRSELDESGYLIYLGRGCLGFQVYFRDEWFKIHCPPSPTLLPLINKEWQKISKYLISRASEKC